MKTNKKRKKTLNINILICLFILSIFILTILSSPLISSSTLEEDSDNNSITIYFFWDNNCGFCPQQKSILENLEEKYPKIDVKRFEPFAYEEDAQVFQEIASIYGIEARGVPTTFIGEESWLGVSPEIEDYVENCISEGCENLARELDLNEIRNKKKNNEDYSQKEELCIHLFLEENCSQCEDISQYAESVSNDYEIEIKEYDVNFEENKTLFREFKEKYGLEAELYPTLFIGEYYLVGEKPIKEALENEIKICLEEGCPCPLSEVMAFTPMTPKPKDTTPSKNQTIEMFGKEIDVGSMPLFVATFLIAFVDGFNPCSLFVLMFLLGIIVLSGSRKKTFMIGFTYLAVAGLVYGLFILMVFNVFLYVGYLNWIKVLVAIVAFTFAAVNIKDFFWYKKGISFTIPDSYKPKIFKRVRNLMKHDGNLLGLIIGSALLALGITLVELPCTAGLPWIWSSIIAQYELNTFSYSLLFLTYILVYFLIELIIFLIAVFTMQISKFEERHGRTLKLIGGLIMGVLGFILLYNHTLLEDIGTTVAIFLITILIGLLISWAYGKKVGFKKQKKLEEKSVIKK